MKNTTSFKTLLKNAAISTKRKAARKKQPVAISENGNVILIYPDKKRKIVYTSPKGRKAS